MDSRADRVLVLAPRGRDGPLTCELLDKAHIAATLCANVPDLLAKITEGAAAALLSEDGLTPAAIAALAATLGAQPPWSDFPIVIFGDRAPDAPLGKLAVLGNVTYLDRPVQVRTMLAAVNAALRGRQRQYDARRAIDSRDQFLAMLGHELRNPLAAITLSSDLLRRTPVDERATRQLEVIDRQSKHLGRLVDDLLDVARVTYGKVVLHAETVDFAEIVRNSFSLQQRAAARDDLEYSDEIVPSLLVRGDRDRLEQIAANLIGNAIKYTRPGGRVRVEAFSDADAVLRVIDTGVGIAEEMLGRVFELFAQADRSLERAEGGMGLGLTVVKSLVQLHGGTVVARSAGVGHGSEFEVRFPLMQTDALELKTEGPRESLPPQSIVLVEDSEDIRVTLAELLTLAGHRVTTAADGPEGVEQILAIRPEIAFVDVGLPIFDGYEVARRVRSAGAKLKLVAVTGYGQVDDVKRALDAGFDAHLKKPVGLNELEDAMRAQ